MKNFIFYTSEGYTYDNLHKRTNNMQLLGHGEGKTINEAFEYFKEHQSYVKKQAYENVMAIETSGDSILNLKL